MRNAYKILVRKFEEKRLVRRSTHRWENNIKVDTQGNRGGRIWPGFI
jgi:hypothetical protein